MVAPTLRTWAWPSRRPTKAQFLPEWRWQGRTSRCRSSKARRDRACLRSHTIPLARRRRSANSSADRLLRCTARCLECCLGAHRLGKRTLDFGHVGDPEQHLHVGVGQGPQDRVQDQQDDRRDVARYKGGARTQCVLGSSFMAFVWFTGLTGDVLFMLHLAFLFIFRFQV